jgi:hypothetical protein
MIVNAFGQGGGSFLEPGDHLVYIYEVKDNDRTDKPAVDVVFKNDIGSTVKDTFWMTESALWRIANLAIACGYASGPKDEKLRKLNTAQLTGRQVMIRVVKEKSPKNDKEYSVVKSFWAPKDAAPARKADDDPGRDDEGFEHYEKQQGKPSVEDDPF